MLLYSSRIVSHNNLNNSMFFLLLWRTGPTAEQLLRIVAAQSASLEKGKKQEAVRDE